MRDAQRMESCITTGMNLGNTIFPLSIQLPLLAKATRFKMDFLLTCVVRMDPLIFPQIGECLSDQMHRF